MAKKHKRSIEEDLEPERPRKKGHKKAHKHAGDGKAARHKLAAGVERATSASQVFSIMKTVKGKEGHLVLRGKPGKTGYRFMWSKTESKAPISTVKAAWPHIKGMTYIIRRKGGKKGVIIRGKSYITKLKA